MSVGGSDMCHSCKKRVYVMERLSAEGYFFHRECFRCEECLSTLRLGGHAFNAGHGTPLTQTLTSVQYSTYFCYSGAVGQLLGKILPFLKNILIFKWRCLFFLKEITMKWFCLCSRVAGKFYCKLHYSQYLANKTGGQAVMISS